MKTNFEIADLLEEAEREWNEGSESQAYFKSRLAMAYALLNISNVLHDSVNEYNQLVVKVSRGDEW